MWLMLFAIFFKTLHWSIFHGNWGERQLKIESISDNGGKISHSRQQSPLKIQGINQFLTESLDSKRLWVSKKALKAYT